MIKMFKVQLLPNNKQKGKLFQAAGVARFAYNWTIAKIEENYEKNNIFLSGYEIEKEFTKLKHEKEYLWLNDFSNKIPKKSIQNAYNAYINFFNKKCKHPKFKSKKKSKYSFSQDSCKIKICDTHIKLEKIANSRKKNKQLLNWIRLAEHNRIPTGVKYYNPRITFDGLNWWITIGVEIEDKNEKPINNGIGIDLGIKNLAICSDGNTYKNINKVTKIKKTNKKKRRLQRSISRKYEKNKKGGRYKKTNNIIKSEKQLLKLNHRLTNIRKNHIHQITTEIVNRKPRFIAIEDLNVSGMMKNKHLSKLIQEQCFYEFRKQLEYKCKCNNIKLRIVDRFYPSSKTCHCCGNIKKDLKLSDRIFKCNCGYIEDRDYNASLNLRDAKTYNIA